MKMSFSLLILSLFFYQGLSANENDCFSRELDSLMPEKPAIGATNPSVTSEMKTMAKQMAREARKGDYAVMKTLEGESVYVEVVRPPHSGAQGQSVMDVRILSGDSKGRDISLNLNEGRIAGWTPGRFSNEANEILKVERTRLMQNAKQKFSDNGVLDTPDEIKAFQAENFGLKVNDSTSQIIFVVERKSNVGLRIPEKAKVHYFIDEKGRPAFREEGVKIGNTIEPGKVFYRDPNKEMLYVEEISDSGEVRKVYPHLLEVLAPRKK